MTFNRELIHEIIFEADTKAGKTFDVCLIWAILVSVIVAALETVPSLAKAFKDIFYILEWVFTILFTMEYVIRILAVKKPSKYIFSFFGIIDLLSILPTYLSILLPGTQSLIVIRSIRLLRIFRVLKLARHLGEAQVLINALKASRIKITVFIMAVFIIVMITGTLAYLVEGPESGFTSIPRATYWAIVTVTTVGYGTIAPVTPLGQILASMLMLTGYAVLAVPTGIVSVELSKATTDDISTRSCADCSQDGHDYDAVFCKFCGEKL